MNEHDRSYLNPYLHAAKRHAGRFESLLWASPQTQQSRFDAIVRLCNSHGQQVLDAGCGHADFLNYLLHRGIRPKHYVGIDALDEMVQVARNKAYPRSLIVQADFLREPHRLLVGADIVVFCGSLNTLPTPDFYRILRAAFQAAGHTLVFNFLSSPRLASASWLNWHQPDDVLNFARQLAPHTACLCDYMDGDCTIAMPKPQEGTRP